MEIGFGEGPLRIGWHGREPIERSSIFVFPTFHEHSKLFAYIHYIDKNPTQISFDWFKENVICKHQRWICDGSTKINSAKTSTGESSKSAKKLNTGKKLDTCKNDQNSEVKTTIPKKEMKKPKSSIENKTPVIQQKGKAKIKNKGFSRKAGGSQESLTGIQSQSGFQPQTNRPTFEFHEGDTQYEFTDIRPQAGQEELTGYPPTFEFHAGGTDYEFTYTWFQGGQEVPPPPGFQSQGGQEVLTARVDQNFLSYNFHI